MLGDMQGVVAAVVRIDAVQFVDILHVDADVVDDTPADDDRRDSGWLGGELMQSSVAKPDTLVALSSKSSGPRSSFSGPGRNSLISPGRD
jgi:hypothetical protein